MYAAREDFVFSGIADSALKDVNPNFAIPWKMPIFASGNGQKVYRHRKCFTLDKPAFA